MPEACVTLTGAVRRERWRTAVRGCGLGLTRGFSVSYMMAGRVSFGLVEEAIVDFD